MSTRRAVANAVIVSFTIDTRLQPELSQYSHSDEGEPCAPFTAQPVRLRQTITETDGRTGRRTLKHRRYKLSHSRRAKHENPSTITTPSAPQPRMDRQVDRGQMEAEGHRHLCLLETAAAVQRSPAYFCGYVEIALCVYFFC